MRHILVDLAQRESMNLATRLAGRLIDQLRREAMVLHNGHRFARFAVLKSADIPSVLIEMGYLSNTDEEIALKTEAYRGKLMAAVVRGLDEHFGAVQSARRLVIDDWLTELRPWAGTALGQQAVIPMLVMIFRRCRCRKATAPSKRCRAATLLTPASYFRRNSGCESAWEFRFLQGFRKAPLLRLLRV